MSSSGRAVDAATVDETDSSLALPCPAGSIMVRAEVEARPGEQAQEGLGAAGAQRGSAPLRARGSAPERNIPRYDRAIGR